MPRIAPLAPATGAAIEHLATTRQMFGSIPNMFATAAHAPAAIAAMNGFFATLAGGSLGTRVGEQIAIAVAHANRCGYCLSAHTAIGAMHGLEPAELAAARLGKSAAPKTTAILALATAINASRGRVSDAELAAARSAGLTDADILEVVAHVALSVFTNSLNNLCHTDIDFPVVAVEAAA